VHSYSSRIQLTTGDIASPAAHPATPISGKQKANPKMSLQELPAIGDLLMDDSPPKQLSDLPKQINDLPDELLINVFSHLPAEDGTKIRSISQK
jgi:hypothetical protein